MIKKKKEAAIKTETGMIDSEAEVWLNTAANVFLVWTKSLNQPLL